MSNKNSTQKNWTSWHHLLQKEILSNKTFIPDGAKLLISVSGGQDSMALLNLINDMKMQHNWFVNIWHGDHQWHEKSETYALELKNYCNQKNISFFFDRANKQTISSEEKARDWRYKKLTERANQLFIENQKEIDIYLLTGHTNTDNAETFLLNLARGSNYAGLSYIEKKRLLEPHIFLIRPLLIFSREDTKKFCQLQKIPIWEDPTNYDLKIKRNLIRKKIIPTLETMYPGCSTRINNFAEKMRNFKNEQDDLSKLAFLSCKDTNGVKRELLNGLCVEARCTILNTFIKKDCAKQLSSKNITYLVSSIFKKHRGQINLPNGLKIIWDKNYINIEKTRK
ncbi:Predicted ATPase of the PP-loop superfamily implicated in cell cycle control [Prochlorococcus marinus str. MIT 9515]|uniref:tRNA(Ile)-lysidine synthase n=1 Tax=Prochlorococcus marinus (strain MIT 9515) TaxID=167542 RepID=A2BZ37_PROM5|nr:tRNA lysidine(34) synthetase TilS [Prochlorococcus marinus]ABM73048.1 Predicted ATPase of the PP-loop superfamily implicated in cell cycle control [Prochlorococcus marinus str. MIT 9515]